MHPLQLPEIRERLSRFIPFKDALACVLVSKAWCLAFTHLLWHTIDFDIHSNFQNLDPDIVAKHGGSIRAVRNIATSQHLEAVDYPSILNLHSLEASVEHGSRSQAYLADVLCRNAVSLQELKFHVHYQASSSSVTSPSYISLDAFSRLHDNVKIQAESYNSCSRTSDLTILDLKRVAMSRRAFSSLLQACPNLLVLKLHGAVLFGHVESSDSYFKHKQYLTIVAPLTQVLKLDPETPKAPPLLIHFPNIRIWRVSNPPHTRIPLTLAATDRILPTVREAVATHCPQLTSLYLDCEGPMGTRILTSGFEDLTEIRIHHTDMSSEMITAILAHQRTLRIIATFIPEANIFHSNEPLPFNNSSQQLPQQQQDQQPNTDWMWMIIPRCCTTLLKIEWPMYEMDMDEAEKTPWVCKWLGVLRIRIRGLDTKAKIERAIQLWLEARSHKRKRKWTDTGSSDDKSDDDGEEDRKSWKKVKGDGGETLQQGNGQESPTDSISMDGEYPEDDGLSSIADNDTSIEARVARHLLKLECLYTVWLGTKDYHV